MPCVFPIECWRADRLNENGKRPITFNIREAFVDQPLSLPCNKCVGCRRDRAIEWTVRNYHELSQHKQACFLTLTYEEPAPDKINKRDLQLFFKRLRKSIDVPIRYFAVGEYGEETHRPHYHAIIYGSDFLGKTIQLTDELYASPFIDTAWKNGHHSIGRVTVNSIAYVCGYVQKKAGDADTFNLMSRKPGIGHAWLDKYHNELERTGCVSIDGREFSVPRKYLEFKPGELQQLIKKRKNYYATLSPEQVAHERNARPHREKNYQSAIKRKVEIL